jgi:hypothetical protein
MAFNNILITNLQKIYGMAVKFQQKCKFED